MILMICADQGHIAILLLSLDNEREGRTMKFFSLQVNLSVEMIHSDNSKCYKQCSTGNIINTDCR